MQLYFCYLLIVDLQVSKVEINLILFDPTESLKQ